MWDFSSLDNIVIYAVSCSMVMDTIEQVSKATMGLACIGLGDGNILLAKSGRTQPFCEGETTII
jgi:hypothetical protein